MQPVFAFIIESVSSYMGEVYLLWHCHALEDGFGLHDEEKLIGVFFSGKNASEAISLLKDKAGFADYPEECFEIHSITVDKLNWSEGFCTVTWTE